MAWHMHDVPPPPPPNGPMYRTFVEYIVSVRKIGTTETSSQTAFWNGERWFQQDGTYLEIMRDEVYAWSYFPEPAIF